MRSRYRPSIHPPRRRATLRTIFLLAAWLLVTGATIVAPSRLASAESTELVRYRDKNWKFSLRKFKEWAQVPLETKGTERRDLFDDCLVARFSEPQSARVPGILRVFRMVNGAPASQPQLTGETPSKPTPPPPTPPTPTPAPPSAPKVDPRAPKTMTALLDLYLARMGFEPGCLAKGDKDLKSKDGVPGRYWLVGARGAFFAIAVYEKDGAEFGLFLGCDAQDRKKLESWFVMTLRSFKWFDDHADDVESLEQLNGVNLTARKRREIETGLVAGWDVVVSPKKNYVVVYNTKGRANTPLARMMAERIEAIRAQVYEVQFPPSKPVDAVSIVRLCGGVAEYHHYGGPPGSAGYWNDDSEELVFYDASPKREADDNTLAVLYHEAFHQYIYYSVGKVAPHSWFNEGHGDYYAGARYIDKKFVIRPFAWRVPVLRAALTAGPCEFDVMQMGGAMVRKWDRSNRGYSPLAQLVEMDQREYYSYPSVSYAQGWGLVYFLREIVPKNAKWNAKWGKILSTYFDTLKAEVKKAEEEEALAAAKAKVKPTTPSDPKVPPAPAGPSVPGAPSPPTPTPPPTQPPAVPGTPPGPTVDPVPLPGPPPATPPGPTVNPVPQPATPTPPAAPVPATPTGPTVEPTPLPGPAVPPTDAPPATPPAPPPAPPAPPPAPPAGPAPAPTPPAPVEPTEPPEAGVAMAGPKYSTSDRVLNKALRAAFDGVDMVELEIAWKESMAKVNVKK